MSEKRARKGTLYAISTIGARTGHGGYLTGATSGLVICNLRAALVGNIVTYSDGSQAAVIDASGGLGFERGKRFALFVSSTARGGVPREPDGEWDIDGKREKVGVIGDRVYYPNGTTAQIISGLAIRTNRALAQFAYVGSVLDSGDTITDSSDREGSASLDTWEGVTEEQVKQHAREAV
ncbi:MAG TPA: hypothetical protein VJS30_22330 [Paraburkholderia sp.]|nr:hypothetical protein [Paraburkholderia sp.]